MALKVEGVGRLRLVEGLGGAIACLYALGGLRCRPVVRQDWAEVSVKCDNEPTKCSIIDGHIHYMAVYCKQTHGGRPMMCPQKVVKILGGR